MRKLREALYELHIWTGVLAPWIFALAWVLDIYRTKYYDLAIFILLYIGSQYLTARHMKE